MVTVSAQEYQSVFSKLQGLQEKFVAFGTRKPTIVRGSATNRVRKTANTTRTWGVAKTTWGVSVMCTST
jgi:hypothetical protein